MQFGPQSAIPAWQSETISDCMACPSSPASPNPPPKITAARAPISGSLRKASSARVGDTQKATTSGASGTLDNAS